VAARVLRRVGRALPSFVKVMPRDYKRVLREQAEAAERDAADEGALAPRRLRA
jgi:glutamate synthase domain-containing protein 3